MLLIARLFLCLDFLTVPEGHADVILGVDGEMVDQSVECVNGKFRQGFRRFLECLEEVFDTGLPGLRLLYLVAEFVDFLLELVIPGSEIVVAFLVVGLVERGAGVLRNVLLDGVGDDLRLLDQAVAFLFHHVCLEKQAQHLLAVGDDFGFCCEELVRS